jgi:hypothetical protein
MKPVGIEINSVVSMTTGRMAGFIPLSNRWCCQTKNDRVETPIMPATVTL